MEPALAPLINEASRLIQGKKYAEAADVLTRAAQLAPGHPDVLAFGGITLYGWPDGFFVPAV